MELICDRDISMAQIFQCLVEVGEPPHVENLNSFQGSESLETLSRKVLETKLCKGLGIKADEVSCVFWKLFDRIEPVRLAHFGIEEANKGDTGVTQKEVVDTRKGLKKANKAEAPTVSSFVFRLKYIYFFSLLNTCIRQGLLSGKTKKG